MSRNKVLYDPADCRTGVLHIAEGDHRVFADEIPAWIVETVDGGHTKTFEFRLDRRHLGGASVGSRVTIAPMQDSGAWAVVVCQPMPGRSLRPGQSQYPPTAYEACQLAG